LSLQKQRLAKASQKPSG